MRKGCAGDFERKGFYLLLECEQGNIYEGIQRNKLTGPLHSKGWRQGYCDFMDYLNCYVSAHLERHLGMAEVFSFFRIHYLGGKWPVSKICL